MPYFYAVYSVILARIQDFSHNVYVMYVYFIKFHRLAPVFFWGNSWVK